mmetsp:Transcript_33638/g.37186  ORF Transcript_33638/g.37186 Transcript_33638/m.37186 type:complete len:407 (-) Transcript_33638:14-1234(-)
MLSKIRLIRFISSSFVWLLLLLLSTNNSSSIFAYASTSSSSTTTTIDQPLTKIPKSHSNRYYPEGRISSSRKGRSSGPPFWVPSSQINEEGYLDKTYCRIPGEFEVGEDAIQGVHHKSNLNKTPYVRIRQVPGDGNCLFHSVAICLSKVDSKKGSVDYSYIRDAKNSFLYDDLHERALQLRQHAVDYLTEARPNQKLYVMGKEYLRAKDLLEVAVQPFDCTVEEYCICMRKEKYWGGGPEVVALCNLMKRPIHLYELYAPKKGNDFRLRRMACFGSPKFDKNEALHILSADSRFPDVTPGKQEARGNHFLAIFPEEEVEALSRRKKKRKILRGGGVNNNNNKEGIINPSRQDKVSTATTAAPSSSSSSSSSSDKIISSWYKLSDKVQTIQQTMVSKLLTKLGVGID